MKILVLDLETTGLNPELDCIVEVGAVVLDLETGESRKAFHQIVRESSFSDSYKDSWVFQNTDLKYEDVLNSSPLDKLELQRLLDIYPVCSYNTAFDFSFLLALGFKLNPLPCPMKFLTPILKIENYYGYKYPKVQEAYNFFFPNNSYVEQHRALDDAIHEAEIIFKLSKAYPNFIKKRGD